MNLDFYMPVKIVSGGGCVMKNAPLFKTLGKRCLIVTGGSSAKRSGALEDVLSALENDGIEASVFDKVEPNPLVSACFEAGLQVRAFQADFLVGIGGGSPLDAAKAAAVFAANGEMQPQEIYSGCFKNGALPFCLVGTTAGTGSEVTSVAVLTKDWDHGKKSISSPFCYAKAAFADPKYTGSCPYGVTVSTALDALCHAAESYFSAKGGDASRLFALKAAELVWPELVWLSENSSLPEKPQREALYYGSLWAGLSINATGTCFPHAAGYALTTGHGVPHGRACAVFLPYFIRRNAPADPALSRKFFECVRCGMDDFCRTVSSLTGPLPVRLKKEQCREYAKGLEGRRNLSNALVPSKPDEIGRLYAELFAG